MDASVSSLAERNLQHTTDRALIELARFSDLPEVLELEDLETAFEVLSLDQYAHLLGRLDIRPGLPVLDQYQRVVERLEERAQRLEVLSKRSDYIATLSKALSPQQKKVLKGWLDFYVQHSADLDRAEEFFYSREVRHFSAHQQIVQFMAFACVDVGAQLGGLDPLEATLLGGALAERIVGVVHAPSDSSAGSVLGRRVVYVTERNFLYVSEERYPFETLLPSDEKLRLQVTHELMHGVQDFREEPLNRLDAEEAAHEKAARAVLATRGWDRVHETELLSLRDRVTREEKDTARREILPGSQAALQNPQVLLERGYDVELMRKFFSDEELLNWFFLQRAEDRLYPESLLLAYYDHHGLETQSRAQRQHLRDVILSGYFFTDLFQLIAPSLTNPWLQSNRSLIVQAYRDPQVRPFLEEDQFSRRVDATVMARIGKALPETLRIETEGDFNVYKTSLFYVFLSLYAEDAGQGRLYLINHVAPALRQHHYYAFHDPIVFDGWSQP